MKKEYKELEVEKDIAETESRKVRLTWYVRGARERLLTAPRCCYQLSWTQSDKYPWTFRADQCETVRFMYGSIGNSDLYKSSTLSSYYYRYRRPSRVKSIIFA